MNGKFFCKKNKDAIFLMQLRGSWKATQWCLRFSELFGFCSTDYAVTFFCKKSSSFISVLQGKCHFSLLLSASSVIRSKYRTRHTSFNLKETRGSKSRGEYDISFLTRCCANATSHRFYDTYFRLLLHGPLLCRFMY